MKKPDIHTMTLREKIGQTGMSAPNAVNDGVADHNSFGNYFRAYPFTGFYAHGIVTADKEPLASPAQLLQIISEANSALDIPLFVSADCEDGGKDLFPELHRIATNMAVGAANSPQLAYRRGYYWAKELLTCGINWPFGPVLDMLGNFFHPSGVRCLADHPGPHLNLVPSMVKGIQDAGAAACVKHYPGDGPEYRDPHYCPATNKMSRAEWDATYGKIWKLAIDSGVRSIMTSHHSFPAVETSPGADGLPRPSSSSRRVLDILRKEMNYDGVLITDAVSMKSLSSAFTHEDIYIECFNAGNDIILFVHNDYIDVMERAVLDGRISMERLNESVERILRLKEELGLFDQAAPVPPLTPEENAAFDRNNYELSKHAMTLVQNRIHAVPFSPETIKKVTIIKLGSYAPFLEDLTVLKDAFTQKGIEVNLIERLRSKEMLREIAETSDVILYACYLQFGRPRGMAFFSDPADFGPLFNALSYGSEKSVVVSFGAPSIYYNYFENAMTYINAYSSDPGTMQALADGLLGEFTFTGKSPVALEPKFG